MNVADNDSAPVVVAAESLGEPAESHSAGSADTFDLDEVNRHFKSPVVPELGIINLKGWVRDLRNASRF